MRIDARAWLRLPLPTLALGALVLVLASATLGVLARGTQVADILATPARAGTPFSFDGAPLPASVDLAAIQTQPLLHASRAFYQKPVEAAPTAPPRPDYRLAGAMILPGRTPVAVLVNRASSDSKRVKPGDDLDGWRVASVDRKQVVLTWGSERAEITAGLLQPAAVPTAAAGGGGLKRVPIVRQQVTAVGGVQSLGAKGNASGSSGTGGPYNDPPRLYRPPPQ